MYIRFSIKRVAPIIILGLVLWGVAYYFSSRINFHADTEPTVNETLSSRELTQKLLELNKNNIKTATATNRIEALSLVKKRKNLLVQMMKNNPGQFISQSMPLEQQAKLDNEIRKYVEHKDVRSGKLIETISDNLGQKLSETNYYLDMGDGRHINVFFTTPPKIASGSYVNLKGIILDDNIAVEPKNDGDLTVLELAQTSVPSLRKVAFILINFSNNTSQPWTIDQVKATMYGSSHSVNSYYNETSYGKYGYSGKNTAQGDFYGWYTIPASSSICDPYTWDTQARQKAAQNGFNSIDYDNIILAFPSAPSCGWAGLGSVGGNPAILWLNGWNELAVVGHELGHNFGALHSSFYLCKDSLGNQVTLSNNCLIYEYSDPYDIMGNITTGHMNIFQKYLSSFLDSSNIQTVTSSGSYTIDQLEQGSSGIKGLRILRQIIPGGARQYYYLEYRRAYGYDAYGGSQNIDGVLLRLANDIPYEDNSFLLDMTPGNGYDSGLKVNQTYTDSQYNISIKTTSVTASSATVQVTMSGTPTCQRANPTISLSPTTSGQMLPGQPASYTATVTNNDSTGCSDSVYSFVHNDMPGWNVSVNPSTLSITHGQSKTTQMSISSPAGAPNGNNYFWIYAKANNDTIEYDSTRANVTYIVNNPITDHTPPSGTIAINNGATAVNSNTVSLTVNASDDISGVDQMRLSNDGMNWSQWIAYASNYNWNITSGYGGTATNGIKKIYLSLKDKAGNYTSTEISSSIIYDNVAPIISSYVLNNNQTVTANKIANLSITASDTTSGLSKMRLSNNGSAWSNWLSYQTSLTWDMTATSYGGTISDGAKTIFLQVIDNAGNQSLIASKSIKLDTSSLPVVKITAPGNNAVISGVTPVHITASDDASISSIKLKIDGILLASSTTSILDFNLDTSRYSNSNHTILAEALDISNNLGTNSISVTIYNYISPPIPPVITSQVPTTSVVVPSISQRISLTGFSYKSSSLKNESITIKNVGTIAVNTASWKLKNKKNQTFKLPGYQLNSGYKLVIHTGKAPILKCRYKLTRYKNRSGKWRYKYVRTCPKRPAGHIYLGRTRKIWDRKHGKMQLFTSNNELILNKTY